MFSWPKLWRFLVVTLAKVILYKTEQICFTLLRVKESRSFTLLRVCARHHLKKAGRSHFCEFVQGAT